MGYCHPAAGTSHCSYGSLSNDGFVLGATSSNTGSHRVESLRWGHNNSSHNLHLTLNRNLPYTAGLTLMVGTHAFPLVNAERGANRNGPRELDSAVSEIFLGFQAAKSR